MALPRLELLIRDAARKTGNQKYGPNSGVRMAEWVGSANDAQQSLLNRVFNCHSTSIFVKTGFISVIAGQAEYDLPSDLHNGANIVNVMYSFNADPQNYYNLNLRSPRQEVSIPAYPDAYFLRNGKLVLSPIPNQGAGAGLKLNYQYILPDLDIRRGLISSVTLDTGSTYNVVLQAGTVLPETETDLSTGYVDFLSIVDADGNQLATNSRFASYDSTTRTVKMTLTAAQVAAISASTLSKYVLFGGNATSHSQLIPICQRYLVQYMAMSIQIRDSNSEVDVTNPLLKNIEDEILASIETLEEDLTAIPLLSYDYLGDEF